MSTLGVFSIVGDTMMSVGDVMRTAGGLVHWGIP